MKNTKQNDIVIEIPHRFPPSVYYSSGGAIDDHDLYLCKVFTNPVEADKWVNNYKGHQSIKVKIQFESLPF